MPALCKHVLWFVTATHFCNGTHQSEAEFTQRKHMNSLDIGAGGSTSTFEKLEAPFIEIGIGMLFLLEEKASIGKVKSFKIS